MSVARGEELARVHGLAAMYYKGEPLQIVLTGAH